MGVQLEVKPTSELGFIDEIRTLKIQGKKANERAFTEKMRVEEEKAKVDEAMKRAEEATMKAKEAEAKAVEAMKFWRASPEFGALTQNPI